MANTLEYYNSIASLLNNENDHYYNGALLVDLDSDPNTWIEQDVDNIIELSDMGRYVLECGCGGGYFFKRLIEKRKSVQYFQKLNFQVTAAGDSYNDLGMLLTADRCAFYNPPPSITAEYPDIHVTTDFDSLYQFIDN